MKEGYKKPNGIGTAGAILSIIGSSLLCLVSFFYFIVSLFSVFIFSPFIWMAIIFFILFIGGVVNIVLCAKFLKHSEYKITSGILGILFGFLIGGIFILISD